MISDLSIRLQDVSKRYRLYDKSTDVILDAFTKKKRARDFYAVSDVSFTVGKGEIVGIIGKNGAGKSTLLKMIAGNLDPTTGSLETYGNVAAILELGTGFHPEYSGRENVIIGGMCLGLSRAEIEGKIDEIIDFSELKDYIDWPFKTYSSGMQSRLTFATATSVNPDILIVDEALSVGDARFQRRSFERMNNYRNNGKTILLVSHDTNTVSEFCDRAILMENGRIFEDNEDAKAVVRLYHERLFAEPKKYYASEDKKRINLTESDESGQVLNIGKELTVQDFKKLGQDKLVIDFYKPSEIDGKSLENLGIGDNKIRIIDAGIIDTKGEPVGILHSNDSYFLWMRFQANEFCKEVIPGFVVKSSKVVDLFGFDPQWGKVGGVENINAGEICDVCLKIRNNFANGDYFLTLALADSKSQKHDLHYDLIQFKVVGTENIFTTSIVNLYDEFSWAIQ